MGTDSHHTLHDRACNDVAVAVAVAVALAVAARRIIPYLFSEVASNHIQRRAGFEPLDLLRRKGVVGLKAPGAASCAA